MSGADFALRFSDSLRHNHNLDSMTQRRYSSVDDGGTFATSSPSLLPAHCQSTAFVFKSVSQSTAVDRPRTAPSTSARAHPYSTSSGCGLGSNNSRSNGGPMRSGSCGSSSHSGSRVSGGKLGAELMSSLSCRSGSGSDNTGSGRCTTPVLLEEMHHQQGSSPPMVKRPLHCSPNVSPLVSRKRCRRLDTQRKLELPFTEADLEAAVRKREAEDALASFSL